MRSILVFAILALGGATPGATEIDAPTPTPKAELSAENSIFPIYMSSARFEEYQPGNHMRRPDVYRLVSDEYEIEFQCGRENVRPAISKKVLNCSIVIHDLLQKTHVGYGISDFYQEGIEDFFRGFNRGDVIDGLLFMSPDQASSLQIMHGPIKRAYLPKANEKGFFERVDGLRPQPKRQDSSGLYKHESATATF